MSIGRWFLLRWPLVVLGLASLWIAATGRSAGPLWYPRSSACVMVAFALVLLVLPLKSEGEDGPRPSRVQLAMIVAAFWLTALAVGFIWS